MIRNSFDLFCRAVLVGSLLGLSACTGDPPIVPAYTPGSGPGYAIQGHVSSKEYDPADAEREVAKLAAAYCPNGFEVLRLHTMPRPSLVGFPWLRYEAVVQCLDTPRPNKPN